VEERFFSGWPAKFFAAGTSRETPEWAGGGQGRLLLFGPDRKRAVPTAKRARIDSPVRMPAKGPLNVGSGGAGGGARDKPAKNPRFFFSPPRPHPGRGGGGRASCGAGGGGTQGGATLWAKHFQPIKLALDSGGQWLDLIPTGPLTSCWEGMVPRGPGPPTGGQFFVGGAFGLACFSGRRGKGGAKGFFGGPNFARSLVPWAPPRGEAALVAPTGFFFRRPAELGPVVSAGPKSCAGHFFGKLGAIFFWARGSAPPEQKKKKNRGNRQGLHRGGKRRPPPGTFGGGNRRPRARFFGWAGEQEPRRRVRRGGGKKAGRRGGAARKRPEKSPQPGFPKPGDSVPPGGPGATAFRRWDGRQKIRVFLVGRARQFRRGPRGRPNAGTGGGRKGAFVSRATKGPQKSSGGATRLHTFGLEAAPGAHKHPLWGGGPWLFGGGGPKAHGDQGELETSVPWGLRGGGFWGMGCGQMWGVSGDQGNKGPGFRSGGREKKKTEMGPRKGEMGSGGGRHPFSGEGRHPGL